MRRVFLAIAKALAMIPLLMFEVVLEAGRLVLRAVRRVPDPVSTAAEYVEAGEEISPTVTAGATEADQRIMKIQLMCESLILGAEPDDDLYVGLADRTVTWVETLNPDMLLAVATAKAEVLKDHLAGRRSIRGVLAYGTEEVAAYRAALERDAEQLEHVPAPRRTRRPEPLLPVFGPVC